ncbi:hypothetical protein QTP81_15070 [Alteromonas sp. ASW11-36]|uniref:Uncharacterized protein n=1 Tax=Alteromonas arenosi TaxID=3055817 RepID=A0ABT7T0F7_9ALTE|nr:hypothetical protein [Alteromonas sp. ASW11-36]MDM7861923.1 hypothetical protein [Alteromonas sp. ASW11-36]
MKKIVDIRYALNEIHDVWVITSPDNSAVGEAHGIKTLWDIDVPNSELSTSKLNDIYENELDSSDRQRKELDEVFEYAAEIDSELINNVMGGNAGRDIKKSVLQNGVDALAYYVPFHVRGGQWGIYIPLSSIAFMISQVFHKVDAPPIDIMRMSVRALHQHELFHFAVEYALAQCEVIHRRPIYKNLNSLNNPGVGYRLVEEQLANASMIRSFWGRRVRGKTQALRGFVRSQPAGYKDAEAITARVRFEETASDYISQCFERLTDSYVIGGLDGFNLLPPQPIDWRYCPVHLINDNNRIGIDPTLIDLFVSVSKVNETANFRKQLSKLGARVRSAWNKTKTLMAQDTTLKGLDFKQWERKPEGPVYSVRVTKGFRAHIQYHRDAREWTCLGIGSHENMGHG